MSGEKVFYHDENKKLRVFVREAPRAYTRRRKLKVPMDAELPELQKRLEGLLGGPVPEGKDARSVLEYEEDEPVSFEDEAVPYEEAVAFEDQEVPFEKEKEAPKGRTEPIFRTVYLPESEMNGMKTHMVSNDGEVITYRVETPDHPATQKVKDATSYSEIPEPPSSYRKLSSAQKLQRAGKLGAGLELRDSTYPEFGKGVFATRDFQPGEWVTVYDGKKLSKAEADQLAKQRKSTHIINKRDGTYIDAAQLEVRPGVGLGGFINAAHGKVPYSKKNVDWAYVYPRGRSENVLVAKALKRIKKGQELFITYGKSYWR
jgi:hypothetical protein